MPIRVYPNPEPVPAASQLAVLPFLDAVDGFLRAEAKEPGLRITLLRAMSRESQSYLQQLCGYLDDNGVEWRGKVGRTFPVNEGIIGAAYGDSHIWRTKSFSSKDMTVDFLRKEMKGKVDPESSEISYLAIPFLGPQSDPVLVLYAACFELNFFADNDRIKKVVSMCDGFCKLFDYLQVDNFPNLRNFSLLRGKPTKGNPPVFTSIQEQVDGIDPPRFKNVTSFNYEDAVA